MYKRLFFVSLFISAIAGVFSYNATYALFSDTASSTNNSFSTATEFPQDSPSTPSASVVINEIMWMGSTNSTDDEWVELKNMTASPIDLTNWEINNLGFGSNTITILSGTIPGNGYFLISNFNEASSSSILNISPDLVTTSVSLTNEGEQLILKDSSDTIIDTANINGSWFAGINSTIRRSMERKTPPSDGTQASNWHTSTGQINLDFGAVDFGTPKAENSTGL